MATNGADPTLPPQNLEAEASVLGAMLVSEPAVAPVLVDVALSEEDFYRERHRLVFRAIRRLDRDSEAIDVLTVSEALAQSGELDEAGGRDAVASLAASVPSAANAVHYARIVKENSLLRRLLGAAQQIQQSVYGRQGEPNELAETAEKLVYEVANEGITREAREISKVLEDEYARLEKLSKGEVEMTGTPSGFRDLDAVTGGFQPGNLVIVAARPSMGKSSFVANIAEHVAAKERKTVAFFSLEMAESELAQRFIASQARIEGDRLRKGKVKGRDWDKVVRACNALSDTPLWIDDSSDISLLEVRAKARRLHSQHGLGLIILDYLQLMRAEDGASNRVEQVSAMSRGLKILARELNVPVIALSQLSRAPEQRPDKRPILSDLRESGQIEQDADLVCFLYRPEYYFRDETPEKDLGMADVIIAKHRNGPTGDVRLVFQDRYPRFIDPAPADMAAPAVAAGVPGDDPF